MQGDSFNDGFTVVSTNIPIRSVVNEEKQPAEFVIKDSGQREEFVTGSVRDKRGGRGRFDLIPAYPLMRLAKVYEGGAAKYGDFNWQKGQPLHCYLDSAERHINAWKDGLTDEDHLAQAAWNLFGLMWTQREMANGRLPAELNDLPWTQEKP